MPTQYVRDPFAYAYRVGQKIPTEICSPDYRRIRNRAVTKNSFSHACDRRLTRVVCIIIMYGRRRYARVTRKRTFRECHATVILATRSNDRVEFA